MSVKISGDLRKLKGIKDGLAGMSLSAYRRAVESAKDAVVSNYQDQFARAIDPYGVPWPSGAEQGGTIHVRTGALANPKVSMFKGVIRVRAEKYGWIHHAGWVKASSGSGQNGSGREARGLFPYRAFSWWWDAINDKVSTAIYTEKLKLAASTGGSASRG
jgi:hypothetical protein